MEETATQSTPISYSISNYREVPKYPKDYDYSYLYYWSYIKHFIEAVATSHPVSSSSWFFLYNEGIMYWKTHHPLFQLASS